MLRLLGRSRDGAPFLAAILAVWSLLVAGAMPAHASAPGESVICTIEGRQTADPGGSHQGDAADCQRHCLAAALTAFEPSRPAQLAVPVAWERYQPLPAGSVTARTPKRLAPRPPGQGPPAAPQS